MNDLTLEEKTDLFMIDQFKLGQKDMLKKVLELVEQWSAGKYSNKEFEKVLRDYQKGFYGK